MACPTIRFKVGDDKNLDFQCLTWNEELQQMSPFNLSGYDVTFSMYTTDGGVVTLNEFASIDEAINGWVYYRMRDSVETATADMFRGKFRATKDEEVLYFPEYEVQWIYVFDDTFM